MKMKVKKKKRRNPWLEIGKRERGRLLEEGNGTVVGCEEGMGSY